MPFHGPGPGRPTLWTQEIEDEILDRMGDGETLDAICAADRAGEKRAPGTFPKRATVWLWATEDSEFSGRYERAKDCGAAARAERLVPKAMEHGQQDPALGTLFLKAEGWYLGVVVPHRYGKALNVNAKVAGGVDPVTWGVREQPTDPSTPMDREDGE